MSLEQPAAEPHRQHRLADVVEGGEHPGAPAHEHHGVGGPQVARAVFPDVHVFELADLQGHAGAAQQIAQQSADQIRFHRLTAFTAGSLTKAYPLRPRLSRKERVSEG